MKVRLLVLGMLAARPMHGYELKKLAAESQIEAWTGILPGSIYHALGRLRAEGLIALQTEESNGGRTRSVFAITAQGRTALRELVQEAWRAPVRSFPTSLYGAALFGSALDPAEERAAVDAAIQEVEATIAGWEAARSLKSMGPAQTLLFENGLAHLRLDLAALQALRLGRPDQASEARGSRPGRRERTPRRRAQEQGP